ncbi:MAG: hypothetical protein COB15_17105, partial [Flavobacteriales bacterium]
MTNGTINACTGTFKDSGNNGNYGNNENFVYTICPGAPGFLVQLDFTAFDVEGTWDMLEVFDGPNVASTPMGAYDNTVPLLGLVTATTGNTSGCLTFRFTSDGSVPLTGWAATLSCLQPCQTVQSVLNSTTPAPTAGTIKICQGDNISFSGSGNYPQNNTNYTQSDATSTFDWDFGDGTTGTGQNVNHSYPNEGAYYVQLTITDVNGCVSTNRIDQLVYVSTTPLWTGTNAAPDPICLGETSVLTGIVIPQTYFQTCIPAISSPLALPDGSGVSYSTCINLDCYAPGQTLNNINDFLGICVDLEHSYMGDLQIEITCPTGQNVIMVDYPNGGGTTFLGVPVDNDATPAIQGTPFNYCWTPTAGTGTWGANAGGTLPAGNYDPDNSFNGLLGCELNGQWCITITDNLNSDNGFIFGWGVNLDPTLAPPANSFTPVVVSEAWLADPSIVGTTGNQITVQPTSTGNHCYTYEMTDDFNCTYDTTICLTVISGIPVFNQAITLCENPAGSGTVSNVDLTLLANAIDGSSGYTQTWFNDILLTSPVGNPTNVTVSNGQVFYVEVDDGNCTAIATVTYTITPLTPPNMAFTDETCDGMDNGTATATPVGMMPLINYSWNTTPIQTTNPATGLAPGNYTVTITDGNNCVVSGNVVIAPGPLVVAGFTPPTNQCLTGNSFNFINTGTTGVTYAWDFGDTPAGTSTQENPNYSYTTAGTYTVQQIVSTGVCADTVTANITVYDMPLPTAFADSVLCNGDATGSATVNTPIGPGPGPFGFSWNSTPTQTTNPATGLSAGNYTVIVTDQTTNCTGTANVTVFEPPVLTATETHVEPSCNGFSDGTATAQGAGGTVNYTYSWNTTPVQNTQTATGLDAGVYTCTVTDNNGCTTTIDATLIDPPGMVLDPTMIQANCGLADGSASVTIVSGGTGPYNYSWNTTPGQSTATASNIIAGTYTVIVTDQTTGCTEDTVITVTTTAGITATATLINDALCTDSINGTAYTFPTGGAPTYTYSWSNASGVVSTNDTLTAGAGFYTVTITDGSGCTGTDTVTIFEPTPVVASIPTFTNVVCFGADDGTATAAGAGGTAGYTYSWNTIPTQTNATATGLAPGTYIVTVFDNNLCADTASVTIIDGIVLTSSIVGDSVNCFGGNDGSANLTINGGTAPYTYAWTPSGSAAEDPTGLSAGSHYVTVTSFEGCTITDTIEIFEPALLTVVLDSSFNASCNGFADGSAYTTTTGGTPGYTYSWNDPLNQNTTTATTLPFGVYTLTVTDANNCTANVIANINQPAPLAAVTGSFDAYCGVDQGTVWASPTNGTAPYTFVWDSAATAIGNTDTLNGLYPGIYGIEITDDNGCKFNTTVVVIAAPGGTANISAFTNASCFGGNDGTATVSTGGAFPGFTYLWDDGSAQTTNPATGLSQGNYSVIVTDTFGCVMNTNVVIGEPIILSVGLVGGNPTCPDSCNAFVTATPNGGNTPYTYNWNSSPTQFAPMAIGLCDGTYTVVVTDSLGCTVTDSLAIVNPPTMTLNPTSTPASCNQSDGSVDVSVTSNGTAPFTFQWNNAFGIVGVTDTVNNLPAGTYFVTATDFNGCSVVDTVTIPNLSGPVLSVDSVYHVQCFNGNDGYVEVSVTGGAFPYTYAWNDPGTQTTPSASNLVAGAYTITITDSNGCVVSTAINITEPTKLTLSSGGTNPSCFTYADGSVWVNASGGTGGTYSYLWNDGAAQNTDTATALGNGTYTVIVTDSNGCFETAQVIITDPLLFSVNVTGNNVQCFGACDGSAITTLTNGVGPFTYAWDDPAGQTTDSIFGLCDTSAVTVIVTDFMGCVATGNIAITEPPLLVVTEDTLSHVDVDCYSNATGSANLNITGGTGAYTFDWTLNGGTVATGQNANSLIADSYLVTVTDDNGCTDNINIVITEPNPLTANATPTDADCFGANTGSAFVTPFGGYGPYTYLWDDVAQQQTDTAFNLIANTAPGYSVTVTDSNNCTFTINGIIVDE